MAKKNSTRTAADEAPRKKGAPDYFDQHWLEPGHPALARENFLAYCTLLDHVAVFISGFITDLHRAAGQLPALQAIALPTILHDSFFMDSEEAVQHLKEPAERLVKMLPEVLAAAHDLDQQLFDLVEGLTGGADPIHHDIALKEFVLRNTALGTIESRARGKNLDDQLGLTTYSASIVRPARAAEREGQ